MAEDLFSILGRLGLVLDVGGIENAAAFEEVADLSEW